MAASTFADPSTAIVVDDKDSEYVVTNFKKEHKAYNAEASPPHGGTALSYGNWARTGTGSRQVRVSADIPSSGLYQVWARWATETRIAGGHAGKAPVTLKHADGEESFVIDARDGNHWILLGTYPFDSGRMEVLELSDKAAGLIAFDAMKLVSIDAIPAPRPAPPFPAGEGSVDQLRQAIRELHTSGTYGRGNDETHPEVLAKARTAERSARIRWDSMNEDFTTHDLVWTASKRGGSARLTQQADRFLTLATAYAGASNHLGMDLRGNPDLLADILKGLEAFQRQYNSKTPWGVNWWDYEIGVPERLLPALVILGDELPDSIRDAYVAAVLHFTRDPRKFYNHGFDNSGANRLWAARIHVYLGALTDDAERVALASRTAIDPLRFKERDPRNPVKTPEGFYRDGSFVAHGLPFVAAYGALMLDAYADVATVLKDTPWASDDPDSTNAYYIIENSIDPFIAHGATVANVVGRSLGSPGYEGNSGVVRYVVAAAGLLPFADDMQRTRMQSLIKKWFEDDAYGDLVRLSIRAAKATTALEIEAIALDDTIRPLPPQQGFRSFRAMDMATHRTDHVAGMLSMNSTRMKNYESIWGANLRGWFQSEGILLLYTPDIGRYEDLYWSLVDPFRFPGITVERFSRRENDGGGANPATKFGQGDFVGSMEQDGFGVAAMHVRPKDGDLEARKAWFFFNDQIVHLGAGIGADSEHPIETTLENTRVLAPEQRLLVDGKEVGEGEATWSAPRWAFLSPKHPGAELGWVFLDSKPQLHTFRGPRTGSRRDTTRGGDNTEVTMDFATLWYDHGSGLNNGSYAYVTLLSRDADAVEAYSKDPAVSVLANTAALQAVRENNEAVTAIVAWEPGEFRTIRFDQPCLLMFRTDGQNLKLTVSDPTLLLTQPLHLQIEGNLRVKENADPAVKVLGRNPLQLEINLSQRNGEPVVLELIP